MGRTVQKLFEQEGASTHLRGQRCGRCGRVSFPPNPYGCESCGTFGEDVADMRLPGKGRLLAFVTTNHANQRDIPVPYTVASIALESGPVIRALMNTPTDEGLKINDAVEAVLVADSATTPADVADQKLRFQPVETR